MSLVRAINAFTFWFGANWRMHLLVMVAIWLAVLLFTSGASRRNTLLAGLSFVGFCVGWIYASERGLQPDDDGTRGWHFECHQAPNALVSLSILATITVLALTQWRWRQDLMQARKAYRRYLIVPVMMALSAYLITQGVYYATDCFH